MAPKGNNMIPNGHFHKDWQRNVNTWFNQPMRKHRRHIKRLQKARQVAPKPATGALRPVVHCPTVRYNRKTRMGRGFTLDEIRKSGFPSVGYAKSVGVAIDYRRRNKSIESMQINIQRLKEYRSKLIVYPLKKGTKKEKAEKLPPAKQLRKTVMPIKKQAKKISSKKITKKDKKFQAFQSIVEARKQLKAKTKKTDDAEQI